MRTKRPLLAVLVLVLSASTAGAACLIAANEGHDAPASSSASISVTPTSTIVFSIEGKTFTVNVTITNVDDLYVWQAGIDFNATLLEAISFEEGLFLKQMGTTLWINGRIDNTAGIIHYHAAALAGDVTGVNDNGTLGTITLKTKSYGATDLRLIDIILLNSNLAETDKTIVHGTVEIRILGDANGDEKVDVHDLFDLGKSYGSDPSMPNWNPECDFNADNKVDASDLINLCENHGKTT
jgi:hypothetical protein